MIRLQGRKTVTSRLCKALVTNPHVLLAEVASDSASEPIVGPYSQSVPVSVHQDKIGQAAIQSFSNAAHPLWRSYDQKVAHIFRAEDDDREPRSLLIVP